MRKIFTLLVLLAILPLGLRGQDGVSGWDGTIATQFAGGNGSKENPYQISNGAELAYLAKVVNDASMSSSVFPKKYFILTNDIILNNTENWETWDENNSELKIWTPIGGLFNYFAGYFDGQGYTISGLYIKSGSYVGLFGNVNNGSAWNNPDIAAKISNLHIEKSYIKGESYVGGITAATANNSKIVNCSFSGKIAGNAYVGGICARNNGYSIEECYNGGTVTGGAPSIGGIAGLGSGYINNCYNTGSVGSVATISNGVGGIIGNLSSPGQIKNCVNIGTVTGVNTPGAIVSGGGNDTNVHNCYYLEESSEYGIGGKDIENVLKCSLDDFKSGVIAYKLNEGNETDIWGQKIGENNIPVLTDLEEYKVFKVSFVYPKDPNSQENINLDKYGNHGSIINISESEIPAVEGYIMSWNVNLPVTVENADLTINGTWEKFENVENLVVSDGKNYTITYNEEKGEWYYSIDESAELIQFTGIVSGNTTKTSITVNGSMTLTFEEGCELGNLIVTDNSELTVVGEVTVSEIEGEINISEGGDILAPSSSVLPELEVGNNEQSGGSYTITCFGQEITETKKLPIGAEVTISVTPKDGYKIQSVKVGGNEASTSSLKSVSSSVNYYYMINGDEENLKVEVTFESTTPPVIVTYHDLHITESVGAKLVSRNGKDRTPDGGSFTLSLEKEEGYEDCEPTVYYKRGRFDDWKELKLDEVSGYYQIRSVYTDIYVKVSGDGIWPVSNEEVEAQEVKVYTQNGVIVVVTPSVMDVQVVSMTGSVVAADKVAGQREFRNLAEGVYIVRVEDEIVKVRL